MEGKAGGITTGYFVNSGRQTTSSHGILSSQDCRQRPSLDRDVDRDLPSVPCAEVSTTCDPLAPYSTCSRLRTWLRHLHRSPVLGGMSVSLGTREPVSFPPTAHTGTCVPPVTFRTGHETAHGLPTASTISDNAHLQSPPHDQPSSTPKKLSRVRYN